MLNHSFNFSKKYMYGKSIYTSHNTWDTLKKRNKKFHFYYNFYNSIKWWRNSKRNINKKKTQQRDMSEVFEMDRVKTKTKSMVDTYKA
jgi:hypothetical protein